MTSKTTHSCSAVDADTATIASCEGGHMEMSVEGIGHDYQHLPDLGRWAGSWWGDALPGEEEEHVAAGLLAVPLHVALPQLLSLHGNKLQLDNV